MKGIVLASTATVYRRTQITSVQSTSPFEHCTFLEADSTVETERVSILVVVWTFRLKSSKTMANTPSHGTACHERIVYSLVGRDIPNTRQSRETLDAFTPLPLCPQCLVWKRAERRANLIVILNLQLAKAQRRVSGLVP